MRHNVPFAGKLRIGLGPGTREGLPGLNEREGSRPTDRVLQSLWLRDL